ncbi:CPBP family intramembrane glutamic endopeptidase [Sphingomonas sp.]|uniref:CPBP family intramembrane glutamic endopeptidase n=1 Tax=Sphingomonas sp. TaxID=28214 RepID=UPI001ED112F6|nr:CPBP family intramembrane glutamic endopeptidase [Sphingomonas sp.]MBX3595869.1 CPBP family intramembrane metalloprotease [Sphingomonas sp.]
MNWLLLLALAGAYGWYVRGGSDAPATRIVRYRRWLRRAPLAFGLSALVALAIAGQLSAFIERPAAFDAAAGHARQLAGFGGDPQALQVAILAGFGGGALLGLLIAWWRVRRGKRELMAGRLDAILPRTRTEIGWTMLLGVTAGVVEELFFRLALPLFAALATGSALLGFGIALVMFAYAHRYQGWIGMGFSLVAGAMFAIVYLATGELWFAMLLHALLNLNGLVLRPALLGRSAA